MKFQRRKISGFAVIVALIAAFTVFFIMFTPDKPLPPYSQPAESESAAEPHYSDYTAYQNEKPAFTVQVPADWVKVIQDGYPTWICKKYNSSLQIQTFPSSPELLNITGKTVQADVEKLGGELVDFYWMDEWDYTVSYRLFHKSGTTAHIEVTAFNTKDAVRFVFIITEIHYDKLSDVVATVLDSFIWDRFSASSQTGG